MRQRTTKIFVLTFLITFSSAVAQVNLVNNPSFEFRTDNNPPYLTNKHYYWKALDSTNIGIGLYYSTTVGNAPYVPGIGYCWPRTGTTFIRSTLYCTPSTCSYYNSRFYPKNRLKATLSAGEIYCVKMYVQMQDVCPYAMKEIQFYLGDFSLDTTKYCRIPLTYLPAQITNTTGIIGDTANWVEVSGTYTATGNENYLVLGCFIPDAAITRTATGFTSGDWAEYNIDDVSVVNLNTSANAGTDKNINLGDSVFIGQPPEVGLECTWTTGSFTVGTGGGLWVKPTSIGTFSYVVTQNICGNIKTDTVNVNVSPSLISEHTVFSESIILFPQPAKNSLNIKFRNVEETISVEILNVNSDKVFSNEFQLTNNSVTIPLINLSDGIYFLKISNSRQQVATKKFTIQH